MYTSLFLAFFSFLITTSSFAQDGCDPQFGCPSGVPNGGVGCDPQFGCPTGVPNNGVGCDPQFGCPTGVPGNGVGCDPQFGCPTGTGGPSTFRGSATGSVYSVSADGYGAFYNHATGEWFTPQRRGSEIIGYIGSKGTQVVSNGDGSFRTSHSTAVGLG